MADYTKVNVQRYIIELIKIKAAADGRSVTNYIERLLLADVVGNGLLTEDSKSSAGHSEAQDATNLSEESR